MITTNEWTNTLGPTNDHLTKKGCTRIQIILKEEHFFEFYQHFSFEYFVKMFLPKYNVLGATDNHEKCYCY